MEYLNIQQLQRFFRNLHIRIISEKKIVIRIKRFQKSQNHFSEKLTQIEAISKN